MVHDEYPSILVEGWGKYVDDLHDTKLYSYTFTQSRAHPVATLDLHLSLNTRTGQLVRYSQIRTIKQRSLPII